MERDIKYKRNIEVKAYTPKNNTIFVMVDEVSSFGFRRISVTNMSPNISRCIFTFENRIYLRKINIKARKNHDRTFFT